MCSYAPHGTTTKRPREYTTVQATEHRQLGSSSLEYQYSPPPSLPRSMYVSAAQLASPGQCNSGETNSVYGTTTWRYQVAGSLPWCVKKAYIASTHRNAREPLPAGNEYTYHQWLLIADSQYCRTSTGRYSRPETGNEGLTSPPCCKTDATRYGTVSLHPRRSQPTQPATKKPPAFLAFGGFRSE